ncbi:MAG: 2-oxoacid:acceptor oxidoreductase family protein [bacterium]
MKQKIIIAGYGGQGIILAGNLLAYAAMQEKKEVTLFKSYGIEMRGGFANCSIIISSEEIGSPIISQADIGIFMNDISFKKLESKVKKNGIIILNSSLIKEISNEQNFIKIPASDIAEKIGNVKITNMVMIGKYIAITQIISLESCLNSLKNALSSTKQNLLEINKEALIQGFKWQ